jgi:hypothetical protein
MEMNKVLNLNAPNPEGDSIGVSQEEYIDWWVRIWDKLDELEKEVKILKKEIQEIKTYLENVDIKIYDFKNEK